jgi:hypothetical protein
MYTSANLTTYIGGSNALRAMATLNEAHWGIGGWHVGPAAAGETAYTEGLAMLKAWMAAQGWSMLEFPQHLKARREWAQLIAQKAEIEQVDALQRAAVAAAAVGEEDQRWGFGSFVWETPEWVDFQGMALPMRIFTAEQVGMVYPQLTQRSLDRVVRRWGKQGYVKVHDELAGLLIWKLTEKAIQTGLEAGLLTPHEGESRLVVRRSQEVHDLAVADVLILLTLQAAELGYRIHDIETEVGLQATVPVGMRPDLRFRLDMGPGRVERVIDLEVVGLGANYQSLSKLDGAKRAGMKLFSTGLDGHGVRHG